MPEKVLVTGANGFVGRHLVDRLLNGSHDFSISSIRVLLLPQEKPPPSFDARLEVVYGDLRDAAFVKKLLSGIDLVFHLAGYISYWKRDLPLLRAVNVEAVRSLLAAAKGAGVRRLIHVSSVAAIGFHRDGSLANENTAFNWPEDFHYMTTKHEGQGLALEAARQGQDVLVINPASIIGPGDPIPTSPHNRLYRSVLQKPFFLGTFTGGLAIVDVRDLVAILLAAVTRGRRGQCYLAVGANVPYARVLALMTRKAGKLFIPLPLPAFALSLLGFFFEILSSITKHQPLITRAYGRLSAWLAYYDSSKSQKELGAIYRPLEESVNDAYQFYMDTFHTKGT